MDWERSADNKGSTETEKEGLADEEPGKEDKVTEVQTKPASQAAAPTDEEASDQIQSEQRVHSMSVVDEDVAILEGGTYSRGVRHRSKVT